ncbi:SNF2-related protein, partial [uncultured Duncaniella sp.]|uniref:SNF2-related protein n=1 Tax=uncultured Duncaniella sp. TaxID=2768039 RepID=UPI0026653242
MISAIQAGDRYEISFPYDVNLIDIMKSIPGKLWDPYRKVWSIPKEKFGFFLNDIRGTFYEQQLYVQSEEDLNVNNSIDSTDTSYLDSIDISHINYRVADGFYPFKHQLDCMRYELDRHSKGLYSGFILADEPGAGKTLEIINLGLYHKEYLGATHCLIICCVNGSKYNWRDDIKFHTNGEYEGYILGSRIRRNGSINYLGSGKQKVEDLKTGHMYGKEQYPELPFFL